MLPIACVLVVTVFVAVPAFAVIVTDVAFEACQLSLTLWPALIELGLAEKVRVGAAEVWIEVFRPQALRPHKAIGNIPQVIQRKFLELIRSTYHFM
jgi:hypothetical protein